MFFVFQGCPQSLYWTLVGNDDVMATLVSEGSSSGINPTRGCLTLLKASFVSVAQFPECIFQIIFHLLLQALGTHVVLTECTDVTWGRGGMAVGSHTSAGL